MAARDTGRKPGNPRRIGGRMAPAGGRRAEKRPVPDPAQGAAGGESGNALDDAATLRDERSWYALILLSALEFC